MDDILAIALKMLGATPGRWISLAETTPESLLDRAPAAGEWSAKACLGHLRDTERDAFPARVRAFLAGQDFPAFDPDAESTPLERQTTSDLAQEFARLRAASLAELADVTAADCARTAHHSQLGEVTLSQLVHEWVAHDLMHTVQGERAMMQPFITECGPWQIYFTDHIVGAALNQE